MISVCAVRIGVSRPESQALKADGFGADDNVVWVSVMVLGRLRQDGGSKAGLVWSG